MSNERPFFSPGYRVRNNSIALDWRNLDRILPSGAGLCLDLGCGRAPFRHLIEQRGYSWIGLDIAKGDGELTVQGDAHALPFAEGAFDCVVLNGVLEHLTHPRQALVEAKRVLKREGIICGVVSFTEPWHHSYYHFSHWGIELALRESGFLLLELQPGASIFRLLSHTLLYSLGKPRLESLLAKIFAFPVLFCLRLFGPMYLLGKYKSVYEARRRFTQWEQRLAFRIASHILFLAEKREEAKLRKEPL